MKAVLKKQKKDIKKNIKQDNDIQELLAKMNYTLVGTYQKAKKFGFVVPDSKKIKFDIYIEEKNSRRAFNDSKVVVRIVRWTKNKNPEGIILDILGNKNDPNVGMLSILKNYSIPYEFSENALTEAKKIALEGASQLENIHLGDVTRRDLTKLTTVTIDSEDAKDLDDAISVCDNKIYVHIADVAHYIRENTELDKEALKRGTSVYLLNRVIPMLPKDISNGICSLNALENRFALTIEMELDENANVIKYDIYESIINVDMRMSYTGVHSLLNNLELNNGENIEDYKKYSDFLNKAYEISKAIRKRRENRGAIDFDFLENQIVVDEHLKVLDIVLCERNEAHKLIEDFMLIANETVAKCFYEKEIPFLYRVHEKPDEEKICALKEYLSRLGYNLICDINDIKPIDIQNLLNKVKNENCKGVIEKLTLRAMQQARYTNENLGHFALASSNYCHFTSPIRRYPDLQIHRIIKEYLHNELDSSRIKHYNKILFEVGLLTSSYERRSIEAERDINKLKECEYMHKFLGEEYYGYVSGVTNYGIYVELDNLVEGMIPLRTLKDDYYIFDEAKLEIYGECNGKHYRIGDRLKVQVVASSADIRTIDFDLIEE